MQIVETSSPSMRRAYTVKEASGILRLSQRTVRTLIAEGKLKAPFVSLKKRLVPETEIARILSGGIDAPMAA